MGVDNAGAEGLTLAPDCRDLQSMVDMDTAGMAQRTLPEALAEAGPALPDEQSATPYHTTDKEGVHDLTKLASKG